MSDWLAGRPVDWPAALTPALVQGAGVFRTLLVWNGAIVDAEDQYAVLRHDAQRLGFEMPPLARWMDDSQGALNGATTAALRWWLAGDALRWVSARPLPDRPLACWTQGIHAAVSPVRLGAPVELAGIKHLNRLAHVLAGRQWAADQHEALMCDDQGYLVCGTRSNLFWVESGALHTPPLDRVGVHGLMHRKITAAAATLGLTLVQQRVTPQDLIHAEEMFVTNSLIGLWPVRAMDAWRAASVPGPVTRRLAAQLAHPLAARVLEGECAA